MPTARRITGRQHERAPRWVSAKRGWFVFVLMIGAVTADAAELKVPLVVDVGVGNNWDEAH